MSPSRAIVRHTAVVGEMHPQANYLLFAGVVSALFPLISPVTAYQAHAAITDMDAHPCGLSGRGRMVLGRALALLGCLSLVLGLAALVVSL